MLIAPPDASVNPHSTARCGARCSTMCEPNEPAKVVRIPSTARAEAPQRHV